MHVTKERWLQVGTDPRRLDLDQMAFCHVHTKIASGSQRVRLGL